MLLNSLQRGQDFILQTTDKEDKTFHKVKDLINNSKKSRLSKLKKVPKPSPVRILLIFINFMNYFLGVPHFPIFTKFGVN